MNLSCILSEIDVWFTPIRRSNLITDEGIDDEDVGIPRKRVRQKRQSNIDKEAEILLSMLGSVSPRKPPIKLDTSLKSSKKNVKDTQAIHNDLDEVYDNITNPEVVDDIVIEKETFPYEYCDDPQITLLDSSIALVCTIHHTSSTPQDHCSTKEKMEKNVSKSSPHIDSEKTPDGYNGKQVSVYYSLKPRFCPTVDHDYFKKSSVSGAISPEKKTPQKNCSMQAYVTNCSNDIGKDLIKRFARFSRNVRQA